MKPKKSGLHRILTEEEVLLYAWEALEAQTASIKTIINNPVANEIRSQGWTNIRCLIDKITALEGHSEAYTIGGYTKLTNYDKEWVIGRFEGYTPDLKVKITVLAASGTKFRYTDIEQDGTLTISPDNNPVPYEIDPEMLPTLMGSEYVGTLLKELIAKGPKP